MDKNAFSFIYKTVAMHCFIRKNQGEKNIFLSLLNLP